MDTTQDGTSDENHQTSKHTVSESLINTICDAICNLQSETNILRQEFNNIKQKSIYAAVLSRDEIPSHQTQTDGHKNKYSSKLATTENKVSGKSNNTIGYQSSSQHAINVIVKERSINDDIPFKHNAANRLQAVRREVPIIKTIRRQGAVNGRLNSAWCK